jgi:pyridoxamine 5'-phosphate oxidase
MTSYGKTIPHPVQPTQDPLILFTQWFEEATANEPCDPNALALATVDADGSASVRMVLLKDFDARGFTFYTNYESRKGKALLANPKAAMCFHWKSLSKQIRIEGAIAPVSDAEADAYFASRPRSSRIGAWASLQSQLLPDRSVFEERIAALEAQYEGQEDIPRPPHWSGFRLTPSVIEFWAEQPFRLHDRVVYKRSGDAWTWHRIYP